MLAEITKSIYDELNGSVNADILAIQSITWEMIIPDHLRGLDGISVNARLEMIDRVSVRLEQLRHRLETDF